jgi:hypothetical protein
VILQDGGGIPDPFHGGSSGQLYYVERMQGDRRMWAFIEVYHMDVAVLPDYLSSICAGLGLERIDLNNRH